LIPAFDGVPHLFDLQESDDELHPSTSMLAGNTMPDELTFNRTGDVDVA